MPPAESDLLFVAPLPELLAVFLLELDEVLLDGLNVELLLVSVLLNDLLDFLHLLVEHLEQLRVLLVLNAQLLHLVLALQDLRLQGCVLGCQV